ICFNPLRSQGPQVRILLRVHLASLGPYLHQGPARRARTTGPEQRHRGGKAAKWSRLFSSLSPLPHAFGRRLLAGRLLCRPTSGEASARHHSYRASSTTCTAGSGGNPLASPPKSPDGPAV